jgi:NAD(P)-dependent dehydrogenase (short-subunit alcohol dehydrogenase family)
MNRTVVITGAGSGVGRAIAIALAKQGWRLALLGRTQASLDETAQLTGLQKQDVLVIPCDVGRVEQVQSMARAVFELFNTVDVLVNAAGTNAPKRSLEILSHEDYHAMMDTNLHGAYYCTQAFLPQMRQRQTGTIVNIVSDAIRIAPRPTATTTSRMRLASCMPMLFHMPRRNPLCRPLEIAENTPGPGVTDRISVARK